MEPIFSNDFSDRQAEVVAHIMTCIGGSTEGMHMIKSQELYSDLYPIDVVIFEPTETCDFYTISTVGLSEYFFDKNFARSELMIAVSKDWKKIFNPQELYWPISLLLDIAYGAVENKCGIMPGQVYVPNDDDKDLKRFTDKIGGMITFAEDFPIDIYEAKIGETYTRFFQVVYLSKKDIEKVDDIGPKEFMKYELHSSDGQHFMLEMNEQMPKGIDRIIKENESSLKGKK